MTTRDVREFLGSFDVKDLTKRGILRGTSNLLTGRSLRPLMDLMVERGVTRLESPDHDWYLDVKEGRYRNMYSFEEKEGNIDGVIKPGTVFNLMNVHINPYYRYIENGTNGDEQEKAEELGFVIEVDLLGILRRDPAQVEPGLSIDDRYEEQDVKTDVIIIYARDSQNQPVIILLKAGTATSENFTHILSVMASTKQETVRGILAAYRFNPDVVRAARAVSNLLLQEYTHQVIFHDPTLDELD